ncbi:MAG: glycosyltransferase [Bacteroidetes bacterium]|nr:glycosyltransferase [Bacteroidota bacterium]
MKKIFITIPWFRPAFRAGGPIQSVANLVKEYQEDIAYYIFCGDTDLNGAALSNIETNKWTKYNDYTKVWYNGPDKISDNLVRQVELIKPDTLFIIGLFSWHYNIVPLLFCKGPKKILSTRGMLHAGALSQKKWKKKIYLRLFKLLEIHHSVSFHATDEEEKNFILNKFGKVARVFVAGNFPNKISLQPIPPKVAGQLKMVSIALISRMKNILLVLDALKALAEEIEFNIYGPIKDEEYWNACRQEIKKLPTNIKVQYGKEIEPQQVSSILKDAHLFMLPSKSENFGHAIYEALSAGRPVITSHHTPWNNLQESKAGINVSVKDRDELIKSIQFFAAMNEVQLAEWCGGAKDYSEIKLQLEGLKLQYSRMFQ